MSSPAHSQNDQDFGGASQSAWGIEDLACSQSDPTLILFDTIVRLSSLAKP